jgi:uncharacterized membrane protein
MAHRLGVAARSKTARSEMVAVHRRRLSDARGSLWFKPSFAMLAALVLGAALSVVDVHRGSLLWAVSFHGDAGDARQLLTVVTGTMITVTSLVFGLTVVTLQIASTQFSPRLLRTFLRDGGTQTVLSGFVGTVSYSLVGLFTVGTETRNGVVFVPRLAISGAIALGLMCIGMLVYYIGHITNAIRIDTIMRKVEADTRRVLVRDHPKIVASTGGDPDRDETASVPAHAVQVPAPADGYVQGVNARLLPLATRKGLTVCLVQLVGYYVVAGRELAIVWSDDGREPGPTTLGAIAALIDINPERRIECDVGLGLRQLVDIVDRAMSTGQNDPYTATQAVHHMMSLLVDASERSFATRELRDDRGDVRVIVPIMNFPTHLRVVCGHIRQGGLERHPRVVLEVLRMLAALGDLAVCDSRVQAIRREVKVLLADASRMIVTQADLDEVLEQGREILQSLDRRDTELVG